MFFLGWERLYRMAMHLIETNETRIEGPRHILLGEDFSVVYNTATEELIIRDADGYVTFQCEATLGRRLPLYMRGGLWKFRFSTFYKKYCQDKST